ncbi:MAG: hypothetical protein QOJ69_2307, partial [Actinomycetota bacterium]|nr:hypothetical protein [Actinomycetota bacterium]
ARAWAAIAAAGRFAVVHQTATTFDRPVKVGEAHRVEASVQTSSDAAVTTRARIFAAGGDGGHDVTGRRCAEAHARLVVMTASAASSAIGDLTDDDARYLQGGST